MLKGSCLCGGVRYEVSGKLGPSVYCHCGQCRKASGASFTTNASVPASEFRFVEGESLVGKWESAPGQFRCFCTRCGSPLIKRIDAKPEEVRLRLGTLDSDPDVCRQAFSDRGFVLLRESSFSRLRLGRVA